MKVGLRQFYEPTPKNLRKLGDALLGAALFAVPFVNSNDLVFKFVIIAGITGKFLTNFFADN
jgi:hypothetical protein